MTVLEPENGHAQLYGTAEGQAGDGTPLISTAHHDNDQDADGDAMDEDPRDSVVKFFQPSKQRQLWGEPQFLPHTDWCQLFFDLFFVAAARGSTEILVDSPSMDGFVYFFGVFATALQLWYLKVFYDSKFESGTDFYHTTMDILYLVAVATAVLHIRSAEIMGDTEHRSNMFAFCLSAAAAQAIMLLRYVELYLYATGQRRSIKNSAISEGVMSGLSFAFLIAGAVVSGMDYFGKYPSIEDSISFGEENLEHHEERARYLPAVLCVCSTLVYWVLLTLQIVASGYCISTHHTHLFVPLNIDFIIHRNGEWIMLMLGESVGSLVMAGIPEEGTDFFATFFSGLFMVIVLQFLHFQTQPHSADQHAMRRDKIAGVAWCWFELFYSAALIALGSSLTLFILNFSNDDEGRRLVMTSTGRRMLVEEESQFGKLELRERASHLFSASLAIVYFCMDFINLLHMGVNECKRRSNVMSNMFSFVRIGLIVFVGSLSQWSNDPETLAEIGAVVAVIQVAMRFIGYVYFGSATSGH